MNQIFSAGAALLLIGTLWAFGKKPKKLVNNEFSQYLPVNYPSLVLSKDGAEDQEFDLNPIHFHSPISLKEKLSLREKLKNLISSGPDERLMAVSIAEQWGDLSTLPILRRGLRDFDSRVVVKAAEAISRFKGRAEI
ncbi:MULTISPECIES: HEAT repeat domain-containing protein [unclassified Prochlorococcus]|uniref:HEAT repeat domain-containing protein n=1 Tax=unclassified Prochlorococcus TaxID=2627481 RepID=UPI0005337238|nr:MULTISPECIES: HEAT repeat domain-containing protein [unclassified Prochlorococcus]KGG14713.1 hypothetical protein EV06_1773 [Prochlorococcus sp. MIT 0602]KGG15857.1 hypothetical protein EV07_1823 [Prochlorococcus sp. MIT 0603]